MFEVLSPGNTMREMFAKLDFYDHFGVEEYYLYDPDRNEFNGWQRQGASLVLIEALDGWTSPRLGIRFDLSGEELRIYRPDGKLFVSYTELDQQAEQARQQAEQARQQAETERLRADAAEQQVAAERQRAEALHAKLQAMGIDPDTLDA